ncbi:hypothetical protein FEM48_Zijuj05G0057600 [Ziziphus jujuba var. spinosa]|uniref:Lysine-specific demethylase REF6 n=1 Tax=Ziziphus jujuba var. spinosa TaxID=714518 RepID=A0A978VD58_ZIZJJ|nr:hypothetical protein FEM48_Zijuj05G0057600 [Ziziphus jujuba var. spinosa]
MAASAEPPQEVFSWLKTLPSAPEYHPTLAEFQDPISYIFKIEKEASKYGICKIVPPVPPSPRKTAMANLHKSLAARSAFSDSSNPKSQPTFTTRQQQIGFCPRKPRPVQRPVWQSGEYYTFSQFETRAKNFEKTFLKKCTKKGGLSPLEIETLYWKATVDKPFSVEYANDMPGSAFVPVSTKKSREAGEGVTLGETAWNMRAVSRAKGSLLRFMKEEIPGVTSPMVYIAMMFSWFAWHVEDHDLHSLNYLHMGAGKTWYGVPREAAVAFEEVVRVHGYGGEVNPLVTFAILGEKTTVMSPEVFISAGIPCCRLVQNPGEFVVTFPRAYHTGFSHGFNCGEAANIATPEWLGVAKDAAIRRASINYPPMVSHYQLLYDLALALCSRVPASITAEPRSSRLKDKKKGEGETVVKEQFVQDVIHNNDLLHVLGKGSPIVLLPRSSLDISVCSKLRVGSQLRVNTTFPVGLCNSGGEMKSSGSLISDDLMMMDTKQEIKQVKGFYLVKGKFASLCEGSRIPSLSGNDSQFSLNSKSVGIEGENNSGNDGLSDQRLFSCVTCGILSFSCVAIIQPREPAARYLMSADCSFFNDWVVGSGVASDVFTVANADPIAQNTCTGLVEKNGPDSLYDVPVQSVNEDKSNEVVSNAEKHEPASALGLLALNYGNSSDSEDDQVDPNVSVYGAETILPNRASGIYQYDHSSSTLQDRHVDASGLQGQSSCRLYSGGGLASLNVDLNMDNCTVDVDSDNLASTKSNGLVGQFRDPMNVLHACSSGSYDAETTKFGKGITPVKNANMPFAPRCDEESSRMHVFCLDHAVEVEQQLRQIGGVDILLLCHPDYPKIEAEAKVIAEDLGIGCLWNAHTFRKATKEDEERIQAALDSEEAIPKNGDWAVKLGINLFYSASLSRSPLYSKQMPYNSVIYNAFGRSSPAVSPTRSDGYVRRSGKQKKVVAGKWCGKVWMSSQVHPFLAKRDPEEEEDEERGFHTWPIPDERLERKPDTSRRNDSTMITRKYVRKRKMAVESGLNKKAKCIQKEDAVSGNSMNDDSHQQQRRLPRSKEVCIKRGSTKKIKCIETEEAVSDDSIDDNSDEQHKRTHRRNQANYIERDDIVSDDSLGVDSHHQNKQIFRGKQAKHTGREDVVSDDSLDSNSCLLNRRIPRSKQSKFFGREDSVSDDFYGDNAQQQQRRIQSKQAKSMEREDEILDEPVEDNSHQQHKRILRNKRTKSAIQQQKMKRETSRNVKQAISKPVKQGTRRQEKMKQQTPRLRNNPSEQNMFYTNAEEELEGGPSTRLRKRIPKPLKVAGAKRKEQQQPKSKKKVKKASTGKAQGGHNDARDEEAEYLCDLEGCTMSFGTKQELVLHKRNVCPVKGCGKKFFSHKYLVQHRRVHMDDRPLRCPWKGCKMTFKWAWARTEHIRVHTGARPYVCAEPGCGQTFRFVSDFSRHKRKTGHSAKKGR